MVHEASELGAMGHTCGQGVGVLDEGLESCVGMVHLRLEPCVGMAHLGLELWMRGRNCARGVGMEGSILWKYGHLACLPDAASEWLRKRRSVEIVAVHPLADAVHELALDAGEMVSAWR
eukprot:365038-Chlamydomonas_euryale.AAC.6